MSELIIKEHESSSYSPRTKHNTTVADVTVAIAVDHTTAVARKLWNYLFCNELDSCTINVAGNGIYTLKQHGLSQEYVNRFVYDMLNLVSQHWYIKRIVCGGQTGVDLAGAVAAYKLGIDCEVTMPKGFKMRQTNGKDYDHTEEFVRELIVSYADML